MSGITLGFGQPEPGKIEKMFQKVNHRGPYLSGIRSEEQVTMAQNYLQADIPGAGADHPVPYSPGNGDKMMICYDGEIGNRNELGKKYGIQPGPFMEEQLLLEMYRKEGASMLEHLGDAIFSFAISDGKKLFAARDLLGIKTLFYTQMAKTSYFSSELKGITAISSDVKEFPEGHYMDETGKLVRFAELPSQPPKIKDTPIETAAADIRHIIEKSIKSRVDFSRPTAGLLSGGMDSSVINALCSKMYKEKFGASARLKTFAIGVGESEDIQCARLMAKHIDSEHQELIVSLDEVLEALPEVIYQLENFDPSLVRSSVSNYLISKKAAEQGIEILLSGEGGDEVFCGYIYLKDFPASQLVMKQVECIKYLHNNASLRLDRMNQCNSVRVVAPLISGELLDYAMQLPPEFKQHPEGDTKIEKWIFRKAYETILPRKITQRLKQEFSQGSGSAAVLPGYFENKFSDQELQQAQAKQPRIRSKEELYYYNLFTGHFGDGAAVDTVGQWHSL